MLNSALSATGNRTIIQTMNLNRTRVWILLISCAVVLLGSSTVIFSFGYNDDYHVLYDNLSGNYSALSHVLTRDGRFVTAILVQAGFGSLETVDGLKYLRAIGLLVTAFSAVGYFLILRQAGHSDRFAGSLSVITFTTPAFAVYNSWAICFPYPLGALAGIGAGLLMNRAISSRQMDMITRMAMLAGGIMATILIYWIYQPIAFFSLLTTMVLAWGGLTSCKENLLKGVLYLVVFASCSGLYLVLNGLLIDLLGIPATGRTELATDIVERLTYLVNHTLPAATSIWISVWGPAVAKLSAALIGIIVIIAFLLNGMRNFLLRSAFAISVLLLSIITFSILKDTYLAHRLYAGTSAWVLFLLWVSIESIVKRFQSGFSQTALACGKAVLGAGLAFCLISSMIIPMRHLHSLAAEEYGAIQELANETLQEYPDELEIVLPAPYERTMKDVFWAEFKTRSSHMPWVAPKLVSLAVGESVLGTEWNDFLALNHTPLSLFYSAAGHDTGKRPELDIFGLVHAGEWAWADHPLFGRCRKVNHLEFYHSPVFGVFDNTDYPYIYHIGLGWLYAAKPDESIAVLMEHGNRECTFDKARFPVLEINGESPLRYDSFIGYRSRLLPVENP